MAFDNLLPSKVSFAQTLGADAGQCCPYALEPQICASGRHRRNRQRRNPQWFEFALEGFARNGFDAGSTGWPALKLACCDSSICVEISRCEASMTSATGAAGFADRRRDSPEGSCRRRRIRSCIRIGMDDQKAVYGRSDLHIFNILFGLLHGETGLVAFLFAEAEGGLVGGERISHRFRVERGRAGFVRAEIFFCASMVLTSSFLLTSSSARRRA